MSEGSIVSAKNERVLFWDSWSEGPLSFEEVSDLVRKNARSGCDYHTTSEGRRLTFDEFSKILTDRGQLKCER